MSQHRRRSFTPCSVGCVPRPHYELPRHDCPACRGEGYVVVTHSTGPCSDEWDAFDDVCPECDGLGEMIAPGRELADVLREDAQIAEVTR